MSGFVPWRVPGEAEVTGCGQSQALAIAGFGYRKRGDDVRTQYQADLARLTALLVTMADRVRIAMQRASAALLTPDADLARRVVSDDADVDALDRQVEDQACQLLARQAPRPGDLRLVITTLHHPPDVEPSGGLAGPLA